MIFEAIRDGFGSSNKELRDLSRDWLFTNYLDDDPEPEPGSFCWCCLYLNLDPKKLRDRILVSGRQLAKTWKNQPLTPNWIKWKRTRRSEKPLKK